MSAQPGGNIVLDYRAQPAQAQPGGNILLDYASAQVRRMVRAGVNAPWVLAALERTATANPFGVTDQADARKSAPWSIASPQASDTASYWGVTVQTDTARRAPWGRYDRRPITPARSQWGVTARTDTERASPWGAYTGRPRARVTPGWLGSRTSDAFRESPWGKRTPADRPLLAIIARSVSGDLVAVIPWGPYSRPLNPGWGVVTPPDETPVDEFGTIIVPVREFYVVINEFSLLRADDGRALECEGFQLSLDADSFTWGWSATIHANQLDDVRPIAPGEHVEVVASINGTPIRLVVERLARDRRFADARLRISGRGRAAWLSDPHSPLVTRHNATQLTAQQILEAALTENGVSIGWALDWRIEDWLVPAAAYSHTGSYIDHANRIAEAGGAIIQPHDTDQTLIVQPRYPAAPWAWHALTPDIELPEDVVEVEGIEWLDRPAYNAVWVGDGNRLDKIKRTGTAGDIHAQTIIDALATAPEATRQRGLAALGDTGRQAHISIRLPVLEASGIIRPGHLVRYIEQGNTHIGLARAVRVDVPYPETWQTVRLETHVEPV